MADEDSLEALRAKRLAELEAQYGGQAGGGGGGGNREAEAESRRRREEMKNAMLAQILDQNARARLSSIAVVKPEKASMVENILIQMAQSGQIPGKVDEAQLVSLLEKISQQTQKPTTVKFERRRVDSDDD